MKNILLVFFFALLSAPAWAQCELDKEVDFEGSFEMDDLRSPSFPVEAYIQGTDVFITFYVDLPDAIVTITSEDNNQEMAEYTISFTDFQTERFSVNNYPKGNYTLTITTSRGTDLYGLFKIE